MIKLLLILTACIQANTELIQQMTKIRFPNFIQFKKIFQKNYQSIQEELHRKQIFQKNLIQLLKYKDDCLSCGVTQFFDLTKSQFQNLYNEMSIASIYQNQSQKKFKYIQLKNETKTLVKLRNLQQNTYPTNMTWLYRDAVTDVKNQGNCSASWVFTTAALAQSTMIIRGLVSYKLDISQQFLLQCSKDVTCQKGTLQQVMATALRFGAPSQISYPYDYLNEHQNICKAKSIISISGYRYSKYQATDENIVALLNKSPLSVTVSSNGWENYNPSSNKIFSCSNNSKISHSVLLIGYTDTYWIAKNSWGSKWGYNGYIYINRSRQNNSNCLIGSSVHYFQKNCLVSDCSHCMTATSCLSCNVGFYRYYPIHDNQTVPYYDVTCRQCTYQNCAKCFSSAFIDKFVGKCQKCQKGYTLNKTNDLYTCFQSDNSGNLFFNCLQSYQNKCTLCYDSYVLNTRGLCDLIEQKNDKQDHLVQPNQSSFPILKLVLIVFFILVILLIIWIKRKVIVRGQQDSDHLNFQNEKNERNEGQAKQVNIPDQKNKHQISINVQNSQTQKNQQSDPNMNSASDFAKIQEEV